jgi:hypothetical protein
MAVRAIDISVGGFAVPKYQPGTVKVKQRLGERGTCSFGLSHPLHTFTNQPASNTLEFLSSSDNDTTQTVTITGIDASDNRETETITLNGLTVVESAASDWKDIYMVSKSADTEGTVTIRNKTAETTITTLGLTTVFKIDTFPWQVGDEMEVTTFTNQPVSDSLELYSSDGSDFGETIIVIGDDATDTLQYESIDLNALDATTPVTTSRSNWKTIHEVQVSNTSGLAGTLTVREASANATICTMYSGMLVNTDRLFGGIVENINKSYGQRVDGGESRVSWKVTSTDWRQVLDRRDVAQAYDGQTIATIINDVQADVTGTGKENFLISWGGSSTFTTGATLGNIVVQGKTSEYTSVSDLFNECANAANAKWWIGAYKQIYMVLQATGAGPFAVTKSANVYNVETTTNTAKYRNRQNVVYTALTDTQVETLQSNDTESTNANSWLLRYPMGKLTSITEDLPTAGVTSIPFASRGTTDKSVISSLGTAFPSNGANDIRIQSTNPSDIALPVTLIGMAADGTLRADTVDTDGTDGTTWVDYSGAGNGYASNGPFNFTQIMGVKLGVGHAGSVIVQNKNTTTTIVSVPSGTLSAGVLFAAAMSNEDDVYASLLATADNATTKNIGVRYSTVNGSTASDPLGNGVDHTQIGWDYAALNGTSEVECDGSVLSEGMKNIVEIYVGAVESARTVTFTVPYTWGYSVGDIAISRTTKTYALADNTAIVVTYNGGYSAIAVHNDSTEQTARAAAETGTGIWEDTLITERGMSPTEADALALDLYNRFPAFKRELKFSTLTEGWYTGQYSVVTWADFDLSGVGMNVVEMGISDLPTADGVQLRWDVKLSNRTVFDGDASFFRELARKERVQPNADRISTS